MPGKTVKIRYIKAHDFKTSLVTGVYGGITSNALININFLTDRLVIPDSQSLEVDERGQPIAIPRDQKDGDIMRDVQFGALMDLNTAKTIAAWLDSKIEEHEKLIPKK